LIDPSIKIEHYDEKNFLYLLAEGTNEQQIVLKVNSGGVSSSFYNRIEVMSEYRKGNSNFLNYSALLTEAANVLSENKPKITFDFTINATQNPYDIELGDKVSVEWGNLKADVQIIGIKLTVDADNFSKELVLKELGQG